MAKKSEQTVEATPEADPNAPRMGDAPATWSAEDMARLDQQMTELAQVVTAMTERLERMDSRFTIQESQFAKLDIGEGLLPAEVADGVSPGQLYVAGLQAAIIAIAQSNPMGFLVNKENKMMQANVRKAFDIAEAVVDETIRRTQLRQKRDR